MAASLFVSACAVPYLDAQVETKPAVHAPITRERLPLTSFYDTTVPFPSGKPGDLILSEPFEEYDLPIDVSALRILYHSRSASGNDVAASGVVLLPTRTPPASGWPVIAWAHGFLGTARLCAPSLEKTLHSGTLFSMYLNLGYAVVATDYTGLGTAFRNASLDTWSNATDIIYSVRAARKASPQLGASWIAVGQGDGGPAVLKIAELEARDEEPAYLGSVVISGAFDLNAGVVHLSQKVWKDRLAFLAYGIRTVYPQFSPEEIFTAKGLARYRDVTRACSTPSMTPAPLSDEMLKAGWEKNVLVQNFVRSNTLGLQSANAPLLVISADAPQATSSMAARVVALLCRQGDHVDFENYPVEDPERVIGDSAAHQLAWIRALLERRVTPSNCP